MKKLQQKMQVNNVEQSKSRKAIPQLYNQLDNICTAEAFLDTVWNDLPSIQQLHTTCNCYNHVKYRETTKQHS